MEARIRFVALGDAPVIAAIYSPYVTDTPISFELHPPAPVEVRQRIAHYTAAYPWLVYEDEGRVLGYAYASRHHERAAYDWACEVSVYVERSCHRRGIGRALYTVLLQTLRRLGYYTAFAGITRPNPASEGLHAAMGFTLAGVTHNAGFKAGRWWDVAYMELALQPDYNPPSGRPRQMDQLSEPEKLALLDH